MKTAAMGGIVAGVFVVGIGVGVLITSGDGASNPGPRGSDVATGGADAPRVDFAEGDATISMPGDTTPEGPAGGPGAPGSDRARSDGRDVGIAVGGEPPPPPPIPPDALKEMEDLRKERELEGTPQDPGGKVTPLLYDFDSEEERVAWEEKHRKRWERRLKREIDLKIKLLREKIGLQAHQETELRSLLDEELAERGRLVSKLNNKEITRTAFDEGVRKNVAQAKERLQATLTDEQLAAYNELKPREQVLRDETK